ncbi:hypothetical protein AB0K68_06325 [Streptomyces sp. NPDC050698]
MESERQLQDGFGRSDADVADERGNPHGEAGGAQVEAGEERLGEVELVVRDGGIGEDHHEGSLGLASGAFPGDAVLLGLVAGGSAGGGRAVHVAVRPQDVSRRWGSRRRCNPDMKVCLAATCGRCAPLQAAASDYASRPGGSLPSRQTRLEARPVLEQFFPLLVRQFDPISAASYIANSLKVSFCTPGPTTRPPDQHGPARWSSRGASAAPGPAYHRRAVRDRQPIVSFLSHRLIKKKTGVTRIGKELMLQLRETSTRAHRIRSTILTHGAIRDLKRIRLVHFAVGMP